MPILQVSPFMERLLRFLIPYFTDGCANIAAARAEALETLAAYGARTRAELLCAVQIIVFSFAALEALERNQSHRDVALHAHPLPWLRQQPQPQRPEN